MIVNAADNSRARASSLCLCVSVWPRSRTDRWVERVGSSCSILGETAERENLLSWLSWQQETNIPIRFQLAINVADKWILRYGVKLRFRLRLSLCVGETQGAREGRKSWQLLKCLGCLKWVFRNRHHIRHLCGWRLFHFSVILETCDFWLPGRPSAWLVHCSKMSLKQTSQWTYCNWCDTCRFLHL